MKKLFLLSYVIIGFVLFDRLLALSVPAHYRATADFERFHTEAFSQKMKQVARLGDDLELIVLGDSRARHGVDPARLSSQADDRQVTAYNLAPASGGIDFTRLLLEENLDRLPRLRTIVWGVSPRVFSAYWKDPIVSVYRESRGYKFDRLREAARLDDGVADPAAFGRVAFERLFSEFSRVFAHRGVLKSIAMDRVAPLERPRFQSDDSMQLSRWGYLAMPHGRYVDTGGAEELKRYKHNHRRGAFRLAPERLESFRELLKSLDERGIQLVVFVPPMHSSLSETPVADHDGTPNAEYRDLMKRLKALEDGHDNFHFRDFHRAGRNDFRDAHWANYDHLTPGGAEIMTADLERWLGELKLLPGQAPSISRPEQSGLASADALQGILDELLSRIVIWSTLEAAPSDKQPPRAKHNRDGDYSIVDMLREPKPLFRVTYEDAGSGIDTESVRIFLNDEDVTSKAQVTAGAVSYKPAKKLETGLYSVRVIVKDKAGNKTEISWDIMFQEC